MMIEMIVMMSTLICVSPNMVMMMVMMVVIEMMSTFQEAF